MSNSGPDGRAGSLARRTILITAIYACFQAVLPPVGELVGSGLVHLSLFAIFFGALVPWRAPLAAVASIATYGLILALAIALPFKDMDRKVDLGSRDVALDEIPSLLRANGILVRSYPEVLPEVHLTLPTSRPSLETLATVLEREAGATLRKIPACGNAISFSFLWGPRTRAGLILWTTHDIESQR